VSKHHRVGQYRECVGGRWAGDGDTFPCVWRYRHMPACEDLREQARTIIGRDANAELEDDLRAAHDCPGCLPREATEGWLCETCDRYLRQWLGGGENSLSGARSWLLSNVGPLRSTAIRDDWQQRSDKDALPSAVGERGFDLLDCVKVLEDRVYVAEERLRVALGNRDLADVGPWDFDRSMALLRRHVLKMEDDPLLVGEVFRKFQDSMIDAHARAPWRKMATKIRGSDGPIACPHCERKTLMQYSGDDFVTCTTCHCVVSDKRFGVWTEMLEDENRKAAEG
jgi:ribosomal protein L37AE/L43A